MERRSAAAVVAALVLLAPACSDDEPAPLPDPIETGTPVEIPVSTTPTVDPEAETGFAAGTATVTLTGAVNLSETYPSLGLPALWVPPPGDFAMTWIGSGERDAHARRRVVHGPAAHLAGAHARVHRRQRRRTTRVHLRAPASASSRSRPRCPITWGAPSCAPRSPATPATARR